MSTNSSSIDLSNISLQTTIGQLPLFDCKIATNLLTQRLMDEFNSHPDLPGVIFIDENQRIKGVISRRQFFDKVGSTPKIDEYFAAPISHLIKKLKIEALFLPSSSSIYEASQASINRSQDSIYDPIIVTFPDHSYYLLDNYLLLLAQARLLSLSVSIEKSRRKLAETFYKAGRALSASLRLDQVLTIIFDFIGDFIEFDQAVVLIRKKGVLEVTAARGKYEDLYNPGLELLLRERPILQQMVIKGEMEVIGSLSEYQANEILAEPGQSWIGIPLMNSDEVIAFFYLLHDTPGFYETHDISTVINFISQSSLAINNALLYSKIWEDANHDALTGLYNRRYFFESIFSVLDNCKTANQNLALLIVDLDHFKFINDQYGHLIGDELLRSISGIINSYTRNRDFACRYGGEEFLIVLPDISELMALEVAERLRTMVDKQIFHFNHAHEPIHTSISIGIALFPEDGDNIESLIRSADIALYEAKEKRNCVRVYKKK